FPISIYIFENFSATHFLSIFYSLAFVIFYPIELALHVIGYGGIFDEQLLLVIQTTSTVKLTFISTPLIIGYAVLSLISLFSKKLTLFTLLFVIAIQIKAVQCLA
ncbi:MAG: hypothetical protein U9N42_05380, partial [Campylobacterota bacterium]|nr:hypothetical protein [Campylobacterota bacterium]